MRIPVLLAVLVLPFAACSGLKDYELGLNVYGAARLNPNEENQPNTVCVKVVRLVGEGSAQAFLEVDWDVLWADSITAKNVLTEGAAQTHYVQARDERVPVILQRVPPEVTHVGVLGLFNNPVTGKERVVIPRDDLGAVEVWLHDNVMDKERPPAPKPATGEKPGS